MKHNGQDITAAYHNGVEITAIMHNGVDVGAFTPPPVPDYQPWENYPDSPLLTTDYKYQVIYQRDGNVRLLCANEKIASQSISEGNMTVSTINKVYQINNGAWDFYYEGSDTYYFNQGLKEANNDIYTDTSFTTVLFAKTT